MEKILKYIIIIIAIIVIAVVIYFGFKFYNDYQDKIEQDQRMIHYYDSVLKANNYKTGFIQGQMITLNDKIIELEKKLAQIRTYSQVKKQEYLLKPQTERDRIFLEEFGK